MKIIPDCLNPKNKKRRPRAPFRIAGRKTLTVLGAVGQMAALAAVKEVHGEADDEPAQEQLDGQPA